MGRSLESRASEKKGCCGGGGRFKIDLPGIGMVTADDDADGESIAASQTKERVVREVEGDGRVSCDCFRPSAAVGELNANKRRHFKRH